MGLRALLLVAGATAMPVGGAAENRNGPEFEMEFGGVYTARNDVRIPREAGTALSLSEDLSASIAPTTRMRIGYRFRDRHHISALYAPLTLVATGELDRDVHFLGANYARGSELLALYRFDSYRLSYRYSVVKRHGIELSVGATAKIRDAEVSLYGPEVVRKTNRGLLPLFALRFHWRPGQGPYGVFIDAEALAGPSGRASDALLAATLRIGRHARLYIGYRSLEGGADSEEAYAWAWFHYAVAGVNVQY